MAYTVDEVSDTLGVPRPTLYRYLREYSVSHLRRAGKIYVPEESFDRIKEIRELHKEGLDTESVRRRLREEESGSPDVEELAERLDRISETLEGLGEKPRPAANGASTSHALQTILARQSLLISEVSSLAEMVEELLAMNGLRRIATLDDLETEAQEQATLVNCLERHAGAEYHPDTNGSSSESPTEPLAPPRSTFPPNPPVRSGKFGALAKRRRRAALVVLLALLTGAALMVALGDGGAFGAPGEETSEVPQEETPAGSEEATVVDSSASLSGSAAPDEEETTRYAKEDYEDPPALEQPSYQAQYPVQEVAPVPLYQEQPAQPNVPPGLPYQEPFVPQPQPGGVSPAPLLR